MTARTISRINDPGHTMRLSMALAASRFRQRIAGTYIGIFWYLLEPAIFFMIILLLSPNLRVSGIPEYPLYLLLGLIMVNFFIASTGAAVRSVRENKNLIQSVNVDSIALPISVVVQFCMSHAFELALFMVVAAYYGGLSWWILSYPLIFVFYAVFTLGVSLILASLGVFIEDMDGIWPVLSRLLWLGTPVFYSLAPGDPLYSLNLMNPLFYFLSTARGLVVYGTLPGWRLALFVVFLSVVSLSIGVAVYGRVSRRFNEYL